VPNVDQSMERKLTVLDDPWEIRNQFLRLKHTEADTIKFLDSVGVWRAVGDRRVTSSTAGPMLLAGWFGHEMFFGRALPITLEELWAEQALWKQLLSNEERLRAEFSPPPPESAAPFEKAEHASKSGILNTQSLHIEWQIQKRRLANGEISSVNAPRGVIQPFTGWKLLVATAHVDLLRKAQIQVCKRPDCGIPFTGRDRTFCSQYCGHLESVRKTRREKKQEKKHAKRRRRNLHA
jgi:hypothetical protein